MIQIVSHRGDFKMLLDIDNEKISYVFNDGATCSLPVNDSDRAHAKNIRLTPIQHKLLHELAHHYISTTLGYSCCPIVYAQAHNTPMPDNAGYLEEIVFAFVYFCCKAKAPYNTWFSYLDRLPEEINIYLLENLVLEVYKKALTEQHRIIL